MKKIILVTVLMVVFLCTVVAPAFAAKPTIVEDVWFVIPIFVKSSVPTIPVTFTPDKVWASDDGTVLHSRGTTINTIIARSPPGAPGSVMIGSMTAVSDFVFDTVSGTGSLNMKIAVMLTDSSDPNYPNPYGVGTLEGTLTAAVISLNPYVPANICPLPGNAQGNFVATRGTGAFENAKLEGDVTMNPGSAAGGAIRIEYIFFGHHINHLNNEGTLIFHNPGK